MSVDHLEEKYKHVDAQRPPYWVCEVLLVAPGAGWVDRLRERAAHILVHHTRSYVRSDLCTCEKFWPCENPLRRWAQYAVAFLYHLDDFLGHQDSKDKDRLAATAIAHAASEAARRGIAGQLMTTTRHRATVGPSQAG